MEIQAAYSFNEREHKSYVPAAIRRAVGPDLKRLEPFRIGPRKARLAGPYISRDYSNTPSGKIFSSDDETGNLWFWVPDEHGRPRLNENGTPLMTRGQFLPWVCVRSQFIVNFQVIPEKGYDSIEILRGVARLHDAYGLPEQLFFENGIWRAGLISGTIKDRGPWADYKYGLAEQGIRVRYAQTRNPRSKIVENIFGQKQNSTDRLRGYAGRKGEKCPEDTARALKLVERGEAQPQEFFMSHPEAVRKYEDACNVFNHDPQNGKMLDGLSPIEAFVKFRESPPIILPPELRFLLARCRVETTVKANGIQIGKFWYKGAPASAKVHERVLAWFNPEDPESICVTDLKQKNPFTLGRAIDVPAFDATPEEIQQAKRINHAQTKYTRTLFGKLVHDFPEEFQRRRRDVVIASAETVDLGKAMESQQARATAIAQQSKTMRTKADRLAHQLGIGTPGRLVDADKLSAMEELQRAGFRASDPYEVKQ